MFITLLLISQVQCEWVQISQQHYRKLYKPTHNPQLMDRGSEVYEGAYVNQSLTHTWNKGTVDKVPHKGTVSRVQPSVMEAAMKPIQSDITSAPNIELINRHYDPDKGPSEMFETIKDGDKNKYELKKVVFKTEDTLQFVSSTEENESNTHKNRPATTHQIIRPQIYGDRFDDYDPSATKPNLNDQDDYKDYFHKLISTVGDDKVPKYDRSTIRSPIDDTSTLSSDNSNDKFINFANKAIGDEPDLENTQSQNNDQLSEISLRRTRYRNRLYLTSSTEKVEGNKWKENFKNGDENNVLNNKLTHVKEKGPLKAEFVTKEEEDTESETTAQTTYEINTEAHFKNSYENYLNENMNILNDPPKENGPLANEKKLDKMGNVLKFMKIVAETISKNSHRSVDGKIKYLENLKDTILANIEYRLDKLWPDDAAAPRNTARRRTRAAQGEARGHHVEIPSAESALMTISFLTFAVYLIKLVLQVIQTYKNKTMMVAPAVVATVGRAAGTIFTRQHSGH
ncbi:uncharacterized protein LOC116413710 [Galleria mellonella]|uniref:Uncharacterized protein LOC116413710 n=1 Tax=Galleria mellonella TaxID=7137 RepID=A0A6J3CCJ3_GALME|nr:uncharacterized protein LOC116413710 [Galleria mellonella]